MQPILPLLNAACPRDYYSVLNFGSKVPDLRASAGFRPAAGGRGQPDFYLSGTYVASGVRIGLIRIPSMSPPNTALALQQLDQEIAYFNANTDGLIVDVMRNPGGIVSFVEAIAQRFIPTPFRSIGFEIRATGAWLFSFAGALTNAELIESPPPRDHRRTCENNFDEVSAPTTNSAGEAPRSRSTPPGA